METLLGKYHTHGISLLAHTKSVVEAGDALFGTPAARTRLGECWLRFFKIDADQWETFAWNLLAAELLHDWGKANDGMQRVLRGKGAQSIRHEHFSALLIGLPAMTAWLQGNAHLDVPLILSAVLTHHLQAGGRADGWAFSTGDGDRVTLVDRDGQFADLVQLAKERLDLGKLSLSDLPEKWGYGVGGNDIRDHRKRINDKVLAPLRRQSVADKRMLTAVRAALIAADAAGSGYAREGQLISATVWRDFVEREPLTREYLKREVIDKRLAEVERLKGRPFQWNAFQTACDDLPERALLLAPCGSGKTLAAWRWIAACAGRRPVGRVLFLYPTRATAKEGFRDYVSWAPEADATLMHANAAFDLHGMFDNGDDGREHSRYEADRRLFSLGYWPRRVFSATVDQFLGFLQYGYGPVCMLPVLADSVIVIDEVHSFDRNMLSALKGFLKNFDVPVLCMTATLPRDRIAALEACGLTVPAEKHDDLEAIAGLPRYTLTRLGSREEAFAPVAEALKAGKRVLWVANTVRRCHEITAHFAPNPDDLKTADGTKVYCYHSRFKLTDRVDRHEEIVAALRVGQPGALGVTTQVCEMSLDLDVDLLVTEECPVTSMIQRMGRCNRDRVARPLAESGRVIVYKPDSELPYSPDDLKGLAEFLDKTAGKELSQSDLEATLSGLIDIPPHPGDNVVMFLESGAYAVGPKADDDEASTFREGTDYTRPCVLPGDIADFHATKDEYKPGFVVPVAKKFVLRRDGEDAPKYHRLPNYLGVAQAGHYHGAVGYCDRPITEWGAE